MQPKDVYSGKVKIYTESFGKKLDQAIILIPGAMAPLTFWPWNRRFIQLYVNQEFIKQICS